MAERQVLSTEATPPPPSPRIKKHERWGVLLGWLKSEPGIGKRLKALFAELDSDGSGSVDIGEFLGGLQEMGLDILSDSQLTAIHVDCDSCVREHLPPR